MWLSVQLQSQGEKALLYTQLSSPFPAPVYTQAQDARVLCILGNEELRIPRWCYSWLLLLLWTF